MSQASPRAPRISEFRAFWDPSKRKALAEVVYQAMQDLHLSPDAFEEGGACRGYSVTFFQEATDVGGSASTYERIRREQPNVKPDSLTVVLYGIGALARDRCTRNSVAKTSSLTKLDELFSGFLAFAQSNASPLGNGRAEAGTSLRPVDAAIGLVSEMLSIGGNVSSEVEKRFFRGDEPFAYFDTYRFSYTPGYIHKSFTIVVRPRPDLPLITFRNFVKRDDGTVRRSSGMVLPFSQQTAFIGQTDNGLYTKVMVFRNSPPQNIHRGLLISEEPEDAIAARVMMRRSKYADSRDTTTGKVPITDIDLDAEDLDAIRNKVDFILEAKVTDEQGRSIPQSEIVETVGSLLRDVETGMPKMTLPNGEQFNPAADRFYTFNSVLARR